MVRWNRLRTETQGRDEAAMPGEQVWSLAAIGALIGAIVGWLTASGALPHPAFLPIPQNAIVMTTLVCTAIGAISSGVLGLIADISDRWQAADTISDEDQPEQ